VFEKVKTSARIENFEIIRPRPAESGFRLVPAIDNLDNLQPFSGDQNPPGRFVRFAARIGFDLDLLELQWVVLVSMSRRLVLVSALLFPEGLEMQGRT